LADLPDLPNQLGERFPRIPGNAEFLHFLEMQELPGLAVFGNSSVLTKLPKTLKRGFQGISPKPLFLPWNRYSWDRALGRPGEGSKRQKATFPKKQRFPCVYAAPHMRSALSIRKTQLLGPSRPFWAKTRFKEKRGFGAIPGVWLGWGIPWNKPWKPLFQPYPGSQEYALSGVSLGSRNCLE
jgi:hypothetical protein